MVRAGDTGRITGLQTHKLNGLEDSEDFLHVERGVDRRLVLEHVEPDGLGQRAALANSHNVSFLHEESRGAVDAHVTMSLLKTEHTHTQSIN